MKNLKHVGYGKTAMETEIQNELSLLLKHIEANSGKPINFVNLLSESVINVLWKYVAGKCTNLLLTKVTLHRTGGGIDTHHNA